MQFLIIAGGDSTRLKPIPDKNLLSFFGASLLERQLRILSEHHDVTRGVIVCNPDNRAIIESQSVAFQQRFPIQFVTQDEPRGLEDAILCAQSQLTDEAMMLIASNDVVERSAYEALFAASQDPSVHAALLASRVQSYFPGGYIEVDDQYSIRRIVEKPVPGTEPSDLVNIVIHWYRSAKQLLDALKSAHTSAGSQNEYDVALESMIAQGSRCIAVPYDGVWRAVKFPWHVLDVMNFFFAKEAPQPFVASSAQIAKTAVIDGRVWIEEGVKIFDGAVVRGPVYLGRDAVVANNALVRESHIGARSVVGYSTEIARSYLGSDVWTHSNYVGDSVFCDDVSLGAGTITGNLRFDEKEVSVTVEGNKVSTGRVKYGACIGPHVRTAINVSLMPGVKIGSHSLIGAGVVLAQDVPPGSFVSAKQDLTVLQNRIEIAGNRTNMKQKLS